MSFSITTLRGFMGKINQGGGGFNYYSFCNSPDDIPGLSVVSSNNGILYNGFLDSSYSLTSDSITFTFTESLSQFLLDNSHARLRYYYTRACSDAPINGYTSSTTSLTNGLVLNLTQYAGCTSNGNGTEYDIFITLDTDDGSYLYNDTCCSPYSLRCNQTVGNFYFSIYLSA